MLMAACSHILNFEQERILSNYHKIHQVWVSQLTPEHHTKSKHHSHPDPLRALILLFRGVQMPPHNFLKDALPVPLDYITMAGDNPLKVPLVDPRR
jgi:hypothetical protein